MGVSILDDGTKRTDIHTIDSREQEYHLYCVLYVLEGQVKHPKQKSCGSLPATFSIFCGKVSAILLQWFWSDFNVIDLICHFLI